MTMVMMKTEHATTRGRRRHNNHLKDTWKARANMGRGDLGEQQGISNKGRGSRGSRGRGGEAERDESYSLVGRGR